MTFNSASLTFFTNVGTRYDEKIAEIRATLTTSTATFSVMITLAKQSTCPTKYTTFTKHCTFTVKPRYAFQVKDVANTSIFTYYHSETGAVISDSSLQTCTSATCPADEIGSVGVDLIVNENPKIGHSADQETVTYDISSSSQAFNPAVG